MHADYLSVEDDHIVVVPTRPQRKHSHTGYDLLRNMQLPGVTVIKRENRVSTPAGDATLYINGREASAREIESLRPQDIARIEYYDFPTGKFAQDAAAVNYILKARQGGGYTQVDAKQGAGFLWGEYNGISKYAIKDYNINVWAGYSVKKPNKEAEEKETYRFPEGAVDKSSQYGDGGDHAIHKYGIVSVSRFAQHTSWMLRGCIERDASSDFVHQGSVSYTGGERLSTSFAQDERFTTTKPTFMAYYQHTMGGKRYLDAMLDSYYSRNKYDRSYTEQESDYPYRSWEDYYYAKLVANYNMALPHKAQLTFSLHECLRVSRQTSGEDGSPAQRIYSSETLLFANYGKRLGSQFSLNVNPGLSYLVYQLRGYDAIRHVTPRVNLLAAYMVSKSQRLQLRFALGNTYPTLNTVNNSDQRLDRYMIRRGNPDMDNSIALQPMLSYMYGDRKVSLGLTGSYMYLNHAIVNDYFVEDGHMINTYSSEARYHAAGLALSASYKPTVNFNLKVDANYKHTSISGAANMRQDALAGSLSANWYVGDFSFSMSCNTPQRIVMSNQVYVKMPWEYDLGLEWTRGNIAVEVSANNLFLTTGRVIRRIDADQYQFHSSFLDDACDQYLTAKVILTVDYGKKVNKSPKYNVTSSESAIMRGKY